MSVPGSVLVVGGGPAGVTAALQAHELGARVTVLEAGQVGGTSLNRGPAPVRTLARAARLARDWSSWAEFGLEGPRPVTNLPVMVANTDRVARYAHDKRDLAGYLRRRGIDLVEDLGPAGFTDPLTEAEAGRQHDGPLARVLRPARPVADGRSDGFPQAWSSRRRGLTGGRRPS